MLRRQNFFSKYREHFSYTQCEIVSSLCDFLGEQFKKGKKIYNKRPGSVLLIFALTKKKKEKK
jgi:hypothetical protein